MNWRRYLPAIGWAAVLLGIGSIPDLPGPDTGWPLDKVAHLLMYGVLGLLTGDAWRRERRPAAAFVLLAALLVGVLDELNQSRTSGRSAELADWIMDAVGILGAFALRQRFPSRREQRQ